MENNSSIFTKRVMGLDRGVWWVMLCFIFISLGFAGYKKIGEKPCENIIIAINGTTQGLKKTFFIGETVRFAALFSEGRKIKWDFGDNSNSEIGLRSTHTYQKEGQFPITVTINNGNCIQYDMVVIKKFIADTSKASKEVNKTFGNPIIGNFSPTVGQAVIYSCTVEASSYEWSIVSFNSYPIKKTKEAQFVFLTPGLKTLQLVLDNDPGKIHKKEVIVQPLAYQNNPKPYPPIPTPKPKDTAKKVPDSAPAPIPPKPAPPDTVEKPQTIRIGNEYFKDLLQDVVKNNLDVADFNSYLCDQGKTRVLINDEKNWTNFEALCNKIRGDKKVTIKGVEQTIENGCVVKIKVKYDRKKFLGL